MTLDEAIVLLKFNNKHIADLKNDDLQQIAEWLEELKEIKDGSIPIIHGNAELELHDKAIRNKAIDELSHELKETFNSEIPLNYSSTKPFFTLENARKLIDEIAEQLKGGAENEVN